jgi:hypothetical protein
MDHNFPGSLRRRCTKVFTKYYFMIMSFLSTVCSRVPHAPACRAKVGYVLILHLDFHAASSFNFDLQLWHKGFIRGNITRTLMYPGKRPSIFTNFPSSAVWPLLPSSSQAGDHKVVPTDQWNLHTPLTVRQWGAKGLIIQDSGVLVLSPRFCRSRRGFCVYRDSVDAAWMFLGPASLLPSQARTSPGSSRNRTPFSRHEPSNECMPYSFLLHHAICSMKTSLLVNLIRLMF